MAHVWGAWHIRGGAWCIGGACHSPVGYTTYPWGTGFPWGYMTYLWGAWHVRGMRGISMGRMVYLGGVLSFPRGVHNVPHVGDVGYTQVGCVTHLWDAWCVSGARGTSMGGMEYLWGVWLCCGAHDASVGCMSNLWGT